MCCLWQSLAKLKPFGHEIRLWFDTVKNAVKEAGFEVNLPGHLIYGYDILPGSPTADDFPCVRTLELAEMEGLSAVLDNNISRVKDSSVQDALQEYHGWLHHYMDAETDLVLYYY